MPSVDFPNDPTTVHIGLQGLPIPIPSAFVHALCDEDRARIDALTAAVNRLAEAMAPHTYERVEPTPPRQPGCQARAGFPEDKCTCYAPTPPSDDEESVFAEWRATKREAHARVLCVLDAMATHDKIAGYAAKALRFIKDDWSRQFVTPPVQTSPGRNT